MADDLLALVANEVALMFEPIAVIADADDPGRALRRFLWSCGWEVQASVDTSGITEHIGDVVSAIQSQLQAGAPDDLAGFASTWSNVVDLVSSLRSLVDTIGNAGTSSPSASELEALQKDVLGHLVLRWLTRKRVIGELSVLLELFESESVSAMSMGGWLQRRAHDVLRFRPVNISGFLNAPIDKLTEIFVPNSWASSMDAVATNLFLSQSLAPLLGRAGGTWRVHPCALASSADIAVLARRGALQFHALSADELGQTKFGAGFEFFSAEDVDSSGDSGPSVEIIPYGEYAKEVTLGAWGVAISASLDLASSDDSGPPIRLSGRGLEADTGVRVSWQVEGSRALSARIGGNGTGIELSSLSLACFGAIEDGDSDCGFTIAAPGVTVDFSSQDLGGLIGALGSLEKSIEVDLGLEWSRLNGLRLTGSSSLELLVLDGLEIGGIFTIDRLVLRLDIDEALDLTALADISIALGPIDFECSGIGAAAKLALNSAEDSLGGVRLTFDAVLPLGFGVALDTGLVTAGGYLETDPDGKSCAGILDISFANLSLTATGVFTTQLPSGVDGWSFLIMISVEFTPLPVGLGFFLKAVGGVFGSNRSVDTDVLQAGIKEHTLDSILFPDDPIGDASQIISDLEAVFPPTEDQYVFGPMAKLIWPNPSILDFDLGIIVEAPDPVRVLILGQIAAALPDPSNPLVELHVDVYGEIDFELGQFLFLASIYDSRIMALELEGDLGMLVAWLNTPRFAYSAGGFHENYVPPAGLPSLSRLRVEALKSSKTELSLEGYYAVTSNSIQFGAALYARHEQVGLKAEGQAEFNALIVFSPLHFETDFYISLTVSAGKVELLGVEVEVDIAGPKPWEVHGSATVKIAGIKAKVKVDLTIPSNSSAPSSDAEDVLARMEEALRAAENWSALPATLDEPGVAFLDRNSEGGILATPAGSLEFRQTTAPMNIELDQYAGLPIKGATRFELSLSDDAGVLESSELETVEDWFATGQYFDREEEDKLAAPDYESMDAGIRFGGNAARLDAALAMQVEYMYEEIVYEDGIRIEQGPQAFDNDKMLFYATSSASAKARNAGPGATRYTTAAQNAETAVTVRDIRWTAASTDDLSADAESSGLTFVEASRKRRDSTESLQVVPACEVAAEA